MQIVKLQIKQIRIGSYTSTNTDRRIQIEGNTNQAIQIGNTSRHIQTWNIQTKKHKSGNTHRKTQIGKI